MPGLEQKDYLTDDELSALESSEPTPKPTPDTTPDYLSDEQMEALTRADKAAAGQAGLQEKYQSYIAPIMSFFEAPAKEVQRSLQTAADIATGEFGKVWERAKTGAEATPMREVLPKIGISGKETIPTPFKDIQMRTIKTSPANLVATPLEMGADPLNWPGGLGVTAVGRKAGQVAGKAASKAWHEGTKKAANVFASISEPDFERLIARRKEFHHKNAPEAWANMVGETELALKPYETKIAEAEKRLSDVETDARMEFRNLQQTMQQPIQDLSDQRRIMASMTNTRNELRQLTEDADRLLLESGAEFKRRDVANLIDSVWKDVLGGNVVGDEATAAKNKLEAMKKRILEPHEEPKPANWPGLAYDPGGDTVSAKELRNILNQIRRDIDWEHKLGERSETLNQARMSFQHGVRRMLSPIEGYDEIMEQMKPLASTLNDMSKYFGTEDLATATLEKIRKGGARGAIPEETLTKFSQLGQYTDIPQLLQDFEERRNTIAKIKGKPWEYGIREVLPQRAAEHEAALKALIEAETAYDPMRQMKLDPMYKALTTHNEKNQRLAQRQAQAIQQRTGIPVEEQAADYGVLDRLRQNRTTGARMAALGGTLGGGIGGAAFGPEGAAIGAAAGGFGGAVFDKYSGTIAKRAIDIGTSLRQSTIAQLPPKFAGLMMKIANEQGLRAANVYHHIMYNNDPEYRAAVDEIEGRSR